MNENELFEIAQEADWFWTCASFLNSVSKISGYVYFDKPMELDLNL